MISYVCIVDVGKVTVVTSINRIANMEAKLPGLIQDDTHVPYCHSENLPQSYDIALDNKPIYYCSHQIPLEKDKVYEFLITDESPFEPLMA